MAPTDQRGKTNKAPFKGGDFRKERKAFGGVNEKKKKTWIPHNKVFEGSVKEGQGFAFQRKQKVKYEYNKLLRRERKKKPEAQVVYKEEYPEHLKHLYLAEAEKLRREVAANRMNRRKLRLLGQQKDKEEKDADVADGDATEGSERLDSVSANPEPTTTSETESLPISNRMRKKMQKKTSYQKTKEKFEEIQEKRRQKREEYLKNKQQREEAIQRYKQKKIETFRMLSRKTKKGQPNLNVQMEYLLQKIKGTDK